MFYKMLVAAALLGATPAASQTLTRYDADWASQAQFMVYATPWCAYQAPSLVWGRDFQDTISWTAGQMPNNMKITWRWPSVAARPLNCGVYAYNFIAYGNYDGGRTNLPVPARQVQSISELTLGYDVDVQADAASFNGLTEFYLTRAEGRTDQKLIEIGFLWHTPASVQQWVATGYQIGTFTDRYGKAWTVAAQNGGAAGLFVVFLPKAGVQTVGTLDVKGALGFLQQAKFIDGTMWFNGVAMGVEPLGGSGNLTIRRWNVTYR